MSVITVISLGDSGTQAETGTVRKLCATPSFNQDTDLCSRQLFKSQVIYYYYLSFIAEERLLAGGQRNSRQLNCEERGRGTLDEASY